MKPNSGHRPAAGKVCRRASLPRRSAGAHRHGWPEAVRGPGQFDKGVVRLPGGKDIPADRRTGPGSHRPGLSRQVASRETEKGNGQPSGGLDRRQGRDNVIWLRGRESNPRPRGYGPRELTTALPRKTVFGSAASRHRLRRRLAGRDLLKRRNIEPMDALPLCLDGQLVPMARRNGIPVTPHANNARLDACTVGQRLAIRESINDRAE